MANCGKNTNKHKNKSSMTPKSSESFVWKYTNWRKIEQRLNILQTKIYGSQTECTYNIINELTGYVRHKSLPNNLRSRVRWKPQARFWREFGGCKTAIRLYLSTVSIENWKDYTLVREDQEKWISGKSIVVPTASRIATFITDNCWTHLSKKLTLKQFLLSVVDYHINRLCVKELQNFELKSTKI